MASIILVEQLALMSLAIADDACGPRQGNIVLSGPAAEARRDNAMVESDLSWAALDGRTRPTWSR